MGWRDAHSASRWHYPGPYAFYDLSPLMLYSAVLTQEILKPLGYIIYYSALDERGELVGVFTYVRRAGAVEIGLALRPDLTGRGAGLEFILAGLAFGRERFRPKRFTLTVATFNRRAITVYERAGFVPGRITRRRASGRVFEEMRMTRDA
jgi:ribosomal-protein-alanine N-acetyltransferase